ncbi:hypothetical protein ACHHRT_09935 [Desulfurivibrio sp. D14AmB]|uniref:hypothetical protein n=1 Tax=Desulfurivibrio sp. D14AmB TaxID=3374370 RepID=UPI00376F0EA2
MMARVALFAGLLLFYLFTFWQQEKGVAATPPSPTHPAPPLIQEIALGYLKQLGGEIQFIKTAVFVGGGITMRDRLEYAPPLAARLTAAAHLHPRFIDTYYLAQAVLPYIHDEYAELANDIHRRGMAVLPDNFVLPFFVGFNHFYHLKDPGQGAGYLHQAGQKPGAPVWFGHLAATLAGEGGDIYGGLFWLRAMLAAEEDELMQERYRHSISMFERAVTVQEAVLAYKAERAEYPSTLTELAPDYLPALPEFDPPFELSWQPPELRLLRVR